MTKGRLVGFSWIEKRLKRIENHLGLKDIRLDYERGATIDKGLENFKPIKEALDGIVDFEVIDKELLKAKK